MSAEHEVNFAAALSCPKCHAVVVDAADSGIKLLRATFPDELDSVYLIALGRADFIFCPVCKQGIERPTPAFCVIRSLNRGLLYVPPEVDKIIPGDTLSAQFQQSWQSAGHDASELETFSEPLPFSRKVCHYIGKLVIP
jgi:hypothetical protein